MEPRPSTEPLVRVYRDCDPVNDVPAALPAEASLTRQLPPGGSPVQRVAQQTKGLAEDLKGWVDLRIALAKVEVQEEIEVQKQFILAKGIMAVMGALAGLFLLITLALLVSAALIELGLDDPWGYTLGFFFITLVLGGIAFVFMRVKKDDLEEKVDKKTPVKESDLASRYALEARSGSPENKTVS